MIIEKKFFFVILKIETVEIAFDWKRLANIHVFGQNIEIRN